MLLKFNILLPGDKALIIMFSYKVSITKTENLPIA